MHLSKLLAATLLFSTAALAAADVDVFLSSRKELPVPAALPEPTARLVAGGRISGREPRLGVPTFFWAERQRFVEDLRAQGLTPEHAARRALFTYAPLYRFAPATLAESPLVELHDTGVGGVIARFEHRVDGVPVFHERLNVLLTQKLELVAITGAFSPLAWLHREFKLGAATALSVAAEGAFGRHLEPSAFQLTALDDARALRFRVNDEQVRFGLVRAQQVLFPDVDGRELVASWYVELEGPSELIGTVVSARDGRVLWRRSLTEADAYQYRVWADPTTLRPLDGPNGRATPHPTGNNDGTTVGFVAPSLISLEHAGLSTADPWLAPGATVTTGNNVEAYADLGGGDGFDAGVDVRGAVTAPGVFGDTFDPLQGPTPGAQTNAGIAQLFYTVNWLHDWFYDRGFNEAAGNAQALNFGRGGAEGDSLRAEAQDFSGTNNANMSTPADGARPRMQMYNWIPAASTLFTGAGLSVTPPGANFGPQNFDLTGDLVLGVDGVAPANDACSALTNNVAGKVVLVDRGTCSFVIKAANVQAAGGIGMVVANNSAIPPSPMGGTDPTITIPSLIVLQSEGNTLKAALGMGAVSVRLQRATPPLRDGAVDNTVVAHEWGHYLSNRLVPGLGTTQARGMGEGWSDFVAMLMTVEAADAQVASNANFGGVYALAVWDADSTAVVTNAPYFGIRRVPYSVDFTKNALTFKHIADGEALPTGHPILTVGPNSEVHNSGEVWATALWECYVALLRDSRFTFAQAQERMQRYLVAGLKLTPSNPTFTEARDGILAAAAAQDLADFRLLGQAFARRGMGLTAVSPVRTSTNNTPVVEDFGAGNDVAFVSATLTDDHPLEYCDRDGTLDVGEKGRLIITLKNVGFGELTGATAAITSDLPGVVITPSTLTFSSFDSFQTASATALVSLPASLSTRSALQLALSIDDPSIRPAGPRTKTVAFTVHKDDVPALSANDDAEADLLAWRTTASATTSPLYRWQRVTVDALEHRFFGVDASATSDFSLESPPLVVGTGPFSFTFSNRWSWEFSGGSAWDGAVLELTTDDGQTWVDLGANVTPAYSHTLASGSDNPLAGRSAWGNTSAGYPAFVTTSVNLGTTYAGQTVRVRLRVATDLNGSANGWDVDHFVFTGITNTPFPSVVADRGQCANRPPVANAGADQTVDERTQVTLSSAGSTDADGDMLTARWTQLAGPAVVVTNGTFTAPEVTADTTLRFSLTVNDGALDSLAADEVEVRVRQVNRAPVVNAGMDRAVDERAPLNLAATATDADGDALTYAWRQVSGPMAQVTSTNTAMLQGLAPEVTANTDLVFELRVTDGTDAATDRVTVTVRQVNRPPSARAFAEAFVEGGAAVTLTGFVLDPDGDPTTLQWTQTAGPTVTLSSATALTPTFGAPTVATDTTLTFELVANDGQASSAPASVSVVVRGNNRGPIAEPGADVTVLAGESVQLDGSRSRDPEGGALTFAWQQEEEGSRLELSGADTATPTVKAPLVKTKERLTVVLYVRDAAGAIGHASVHVNVEPKPASGCGCAGVSGLEPLLFLGAAMLLRRRRK
ncbi:MAG: myxosortase-dependent M36 family metallopeptidase [Myxococcota bacterium]